jgi:hypothetical protein
MRQSVVWSLISTIVLCVAPYLLLSSYCTAPTPSDAQRLSDFRNESSKKSGHDMQEQKQKPSPLAASVKSNTTLEQGKSAPAGAADDVDRSDEWRRKFWCDVKVTDVGLAVFTLLLVIATAGLIWAAARQERWARRAWKTARYANGLAKEAFISTNRPRIRLKHLWVQGDLFDERIPLKFSLVIVNAGLTPAFDMQGEIAVVILQPNERLPARPQFPGLKVFTTTVRELPSGITVEFANLIDDRHSTLTTDEWVQLRNSSALLYCYGYVDYRDGSKRLRRTTFCRVLRPTVGNVLNSDNARFAKLDFEDTDYEYED